jgi:integrase
MAEAGMDPKILQGIMGHSDISMTMNVYNHGSIERMQNEMKKLDKYM